MGNFIETIENNNKTYLPHFIGNIIENFKFLENNEIKAPN